MSETETDYMPVGVGLSFTVFDEDGKLKSTRKDHGLSARIDWLVDRSRKYKCALAGGDYVAMKLLDDEMQARLIEALEYVIGNDNPEYCPDCGLKLTNGANSFDRQDYCPHCGAHIFQK